MPDTPLLVDADSVARDIGVPLPLTADQRTRIEDAIRAGQLDVQTHLLRPLVPEEVTLTGLIPKPGHDVMSWRAWGSTLFDEEFTIVSATEASDGTWTVVFLVGLQDPVALGAITRYVRAHAGESVRLSPGSTMGQRQITSMSADGQSVSLEQAKTTHGVPGGLPTLDTLDTWRRRTPSAFQSDRQHRGPWSMSSAPVGWDPS